MRYSIFSINNNLSINWENMVSIWINGILSSLGILCILRFFLVLVKVLLTYIWRLLAKCSSSSLYSACGNKRLKQIRRIFSNKCPCKFSTWPNWRKEVFCGRGSQEWYKVRLPQTALSFDEAKKVSPFVKYE